MANLVYKRVPTDQQSTAPQNLVLTEAVFEDPAVFEEDAGTSSSLHPLQRPKFLARCQPVDGTQGLPVVPARRKARREYENRASALALADHRAGLRGRGVSPNSG
ncbi:hypothetical protein AB0N06_37325 [Streptomyces sp. NPDC051020]|uniref:hypothetical protein n=1 Tax=Streptomyces sp. NPDC051020 TaxID=3155409 RepID=UPI0034219851